MKEQFEVIAKKFLLHLLAINILLLVFFVLSLIPIPSQYGYVHEPFMTIESVMKNKGLIAISWIVANVVLFIMSKDVKIKPSKKNDDSEETE